MTTTSCGIVCGSIELHEAVASSPPSVARARQCRDLTKPTHMQASAVGPAGGMPGSQLAPAGPTAAW